VPDRLYPALIWFSARPHFGQRRFSSIVCFLISTLYHTFSCLQRRYLGTPDESTFEFCFDGIAKGSAVAVSTYMAWAKFMEGDYDDVMHVGYRELKKSHWICEQCYQDFKEMFSFKVED